MFLLLSFRTMSALPGMMFGDYRGLSELFGVAPPRWSVLFKRHVLSSEFFSPFKLRSQIFSHGRQIFRKDVKLTASWCTRIYAIYSRHGVRVTWFDQKASANIWGTMAVFLMHCEVYAHVYVYQPFRFCLQIPCIDTNVLIVPTDKLH